MKWLLGFCIPAVIAACLAVGFGGCSTAQQASASAKLAQLQTTVVNGCMVVQPTLTAVAALDPQISAAATANGLFCATASAISVTSIQTMLQTGIPAIDSAITQSTLIPAADKPLYVAAIGIFELTLTNALAVFNAGATTATPASAASAASS
jgi:uncharacterized membrane protein YtjA (UPF0391 family)